LGLSAVGEHGQNLPLAVARGLKHQMTAVGRPTGPLVFAAVARDLHDIVSCRFHQIDIEVAVGPPPTERQQLTVGRPGWVDQVAFVRHGDFRRAGAIRVHHVQLRNAATVADEYYALAGLRVPRRGGAGAGCKSLALGTASYRAPRPPLHLTHTQ